MKKIIILLNIITILFTSVSFAVLTPELEQFYKVQGFDSDLWIIEIILLIISWIRKKEIHKGLKLLFLVWTIIRLVIAFNYIYNWKFYIPCIVLGIIIITYTLTINFTNNKNSKGEIENGRND